MISNEALRALVARQIDGATGEFNGDISSDRADLMDRYLGEPYGDEIEGRSRVVMSDVADTVEWLMPELMDIFTGGDDVVEFNPVGQEDEDAARQETAVVNHILQQRNNGFILLHTWFKDALLQKNGFVKSYWDQRTVEEAEEYADLGPDEAVMVLNQIAEGADEIEIVEQAEDLSAFKVKTRRTVDEYKVVPVPPEEFLITPRWNSIDLTGVPFVAHRSSKTVSELIEMGFDRKQVESLPDDNEDLSGELAERFSARGNSEYSDGDEADPSMREVTLYECYVMADRNEDGVAELLQVYMGGNSQTLMKWADGSPAVEEADGQPFDALTPVLMSHKFFGRSVAELVDDLQRIRTVLVRQMLDNIYINNNPRPHVDTTAATDETIEDLLNPAVGYPVRGRGPQAGVTYPGMPDMTGGILQGIEYVDHLRENRTGVTKYNQGLDANSLNKTATGIRSIMSASQKKIMLIARIFAETGVKSLMRRIHKNLRKGPVKEIAAKLRNEWVTVNPRLWRDRADMTVSVGLGTGDKDQMLARLNAILERQVQALEGGLASREQILHTLHKMVETAGFKAPELFFGLQEQPQQQGNPAQDLLQAQMAAEMGKAQIKAQSDLQREQIKAQVAAGKAQLDAEGQAAKMRQDGAIAIMDDDRARDLALADLAVELKKMEADGVKAISLEALKAMMQPPAVMNEIA